jgi:hypothetical protein
MWAEALLLLSAPRVRSNEAGFQGKGARRREYGHHGRDEGLSANRYYQPDTGTVGEDDVQAPAGNGTNH